MRKLKHDEILRLDASGLATVTRHPIVLILENIRSAHNVGSIIRTADAALIEEVVVTGYTADPDHRSALKTALGAQDTVPWSRSDTAVEAAAAYRRRGYKIVSLELTDVSRDPTSLEISDFPLCLVAGNEVDGVSNQLIELSDFAIEVPQFGVKQSLNVSVAVGVALFDLVRVVRRTDSKNV